MLPCLEANRRRLIARNNANNNNRTQSTQSMLKAMTDILIAFFYNNDI